MNYNIDDKEFRVEVMNMHNSGYNIKSMVEKFNISESALKDIIITFKNISIDIDLRYDLSDEEKQFIIDNYKKGVNFLVRSLKDVPSRKILNCYSVYKSKQKKDNVIKEKEEQETKNKKALSHYTKEEIEFIRESYENGDSVVDIAMALDRSPSAIKGVLTKRKIYRKKEEPGFKRCPKCGKSKPTTEFYFGSRGFSCYCIDCSRKMYKKYYNNNVKKQKKDTPEFKKCPKCNQIKPRSEFYQIKSKPNGLSSYCKDCERKRNNINKHNKEK